jgi:SAM-dependent methyltransferase
MQTLSNERILACALRHALDQMRYFNRKEGHKVSNTGGYEFIANDYKKVISLLRAAREIKPNARKFLDCGCGSGWVPIIANNFFGFDGYGIDFNESLIGFCKGIYIQQKNDNYMLGNLLEWTDYSPYEVIYYYHPFSYIEQQLKFESLLFSNIRLGTLVLSSRTRSIYEDAPDFLEKYNLMIRGYCNERFVKRCPSKTLVKRLSTLILEKTK